MSVQITDKSPLSAGVTMECAGPDAHPVVPDIDYWIDRAAVSGSGFVHNGAPWASAAAVQVWRPDPARYVVA